MAFSARDLINKATVEDGTFEIVLEGGDTITVRKLTDVRKLFEIKRRALQIVKMANAGNAPPEWKPYLPITEDVAEIMVYIVGLVIEPKFSDLEVLELCQCGGMTAAFILGVIKMTLERTVPLAEADQLDDLKNASVPTPSGETTS